MRVDGERGRRASWSRSTPATSSSGSCAGCGAVSTAAARPRDALDHSSPDYGRAVDDDAPSMSRPRLRGASDARAEPYAAVPTLMFRLRRDRDRAATRSTPSRCGARSRSSRSAAATRRTKRRGCSSCSASTPQWGDSLRPFLWTHVDDDAHRVHRHDRGRPAGHRAPTTSRWRPPSTCTSSATATSRSRCCSAARCSPAATASCRCSRCRGTSRRTTASRSRVARPDGPVLPEQRLDPAAPRHHRRAHPVQGRAAIPTWEDTFELLLKEAGEESDRVDRADRVRPARGRVADAVLYEGYVLYPYRASATKNQCAGSSASSCPGRYAEADGAEHGRSRPRSSPSSGSPATVDVRVRFLQVQARTVEAAERGGFVPVARARRRRTAVGEWEEAVEHVVDVTDIDLCHDRRHRRRPFVLPGRGESGGARHARAGRAGACAAVDGVVRVVIEDVPGPYPLTRLRGRGSRTPPSGRAPTRRETTSCGGRWSRVHVLLARRRRLVRVVARPARVRPRRGRRRARTTARSPC